MQRERQEVSTRNCRTPPLRVGRGCWRAVWIHLALIPWGCGPAPDQAGPSAETEVPTVTVAAVEERLVAREHTCVGTVTPVRTSTIGSPVEDRVVECTVEEGDFVRAERSKGASPLVRLRTEAAEIELAAAKAELRVREHGLEELRLRAPKEIEKAKASKDAAEALRDFTRSRLERTRELHGQGVVGDQDLDEHASAAETAEKAYLERRTEWELARSGLWAERIKQAEASVETQRQSIARVKDRLAQRLVFAPFDGFVTRKYAEIGQWLATGDPIVDVVEIDEVFVEAPVPERYVSRLRAGTVARVEIGALPGHSFLGEVEAIVPRADLQSRCFPVKVRLKNRRSPPGVGDLLLKPGMFARVTFPVEQVTRWLVPKDAVVLTGSSQVVWVIERQSGEEVLGPATVKRVPVQVDLETSDREWTAIQGPVDGTGSLPLRPGQWVVVEGNERLTPALQVNTAKIWSLHGLD